MENIKLETTGQKHTKNIATLADDIKQLIANISKGKSFIISNYSYIVPVDRKKSVNITK